MDDTIQNYRPREAAKMLCIGLSTIWLFIKQGKLKSHKLSERVTIIKHSDLLAFIDGRNIESNSV